MRLCLLLLLWSPQSCALSWPWSWFWSSGSEEAVPPRVSCKDENNNDVNWYILYKAPGGQEYIYISRETQNINQEIGAPYGVLANTLSPIFDNTKPKGFGFWFYNDQPPPEGKSVGSNYGHSKGVVLWDSMTTVWITHSTPRFPFSRNPNRFWPERNSFWPESGIVNGQTFMCVTLPYSQLQIISTHLHNIHAYVFQQYPHSSFLEEITGNNRDQTFLPGPLIQSLNRNLIAVAKGTGSTAAVGDLYVQLSRHFSSNMDAKTWGCQRGKDESYCIAGQPEVLSVMNVTTVLGAWGWTKDHSKWAVTKHGIGWTCIADMNRAKTQYERPGGALCIQDETTTNLFRGFVMRTLPCGVDPRNLPGNCENDPDEEINLREDL